MKEIRGYTAGKMGGLSYNQYSSWRKELTTRLIDRCGDDVRLTMINPSEFFNFEMDRDSYTYKEIYNWEIGQVKKCDFIIAKLEGGKSQGTSHELAIANEYDIPVIALYSDRDIIHPFDAQCIDKWCETFDELVDYIAFYHLI